MTVGIKNTIEYKWIQKKKSCNGQNINERKKLKK